MFKPSAGSVLLCLTGIAAALAARASHPVQFEIDRTFLRTLSQIPVSRALTPDEESLFASLAWDNELELKYLAAKGDPLAVRSVVRLIARGGAPGGCCCTSGAFDDSVFQAGTTPEFWEALDALDPQRQLAVLFVGDAHPYSELNADTTWEGDRDAYLAQHQDLQRAYAASLMAQAALDSQAAPTSVNP